MLVSPSRNGSRKINLLICLPCCFSGELVTQVNKNSCSSVKGNKNLVNCFRRLGMMAVGIFQQESRQVVWDGRKLCSQGEVISYSYLCQIKGEGNGQL